MTVHDDLPPVHIDQERMKRALAGPFFVVPHGFTSFEVIALMNEVAEHIETGGASEVIA